MKPLILFLFFLTALPASAQKLCTCTVEIGGHKQDYLSCDTTRLRNGATLYFRCTPKMYWLTLQQKSGKKTILFRETESDVFHLAYRLTYKLVKEYKSSLLFRYGCAANGPCMFAVVNKNTGKLVLDIEAEELLKDPYIERPNFLLFYGSDFSQLQLLYLNTLRQYSLSVDVLRLPQDPDYTLMRITTTETKILLHYKYYDDQDLVRSIDRRRYPE